MFKEFSRSYEKNKNIIMAGNKIPICLIIKIIGLKKLKERANLIIGLMERQKYLSTTEAKFARDNPAILSKLAQARAGGYFADWVMASLPKYLTYQTTDDVVITTTFDPLLQTAAEEAALP